MTIFNFYNADDFADGSPLSFYLTEVVCMGPMIACILKKFGSANPTATKFKPIN